MSGLGEGSGRREWPDWVAEPLERVGITRHETLETIRPKIKALGLEIVRMGEDWGGVLSRYPLYHAEVTDPGDEGCVLGMYSSKSDYVEALSWATAQVLRDKQERQEMGQANEDDN